MFMGNTISINIYHCLCTVEPHCVSLSSYCKKVFYTNTYYHDVNTMESVLFNSASSHLLLHILNT